MNSDIVLQLKDAGVKKGERWLVEHIDLTLERKKIVTLIGPNGSGKTTTAKMILGITRPSHGVVWRQSGIKIGYVPQKLALDGSLPLSVERFMRLTCQISLSHMQEALEKVNAFHLFHEPLIHLSGGELQRVLLARAIALKPDALVLDEPTQGVDYNGEEQLYQLISELRYSLNCAVLLISHDLHLVMSSTDHVICLNGHICCSGTPENVSSSQAYVHLFGQSALAIYQHKHKPDL